MSAIIEETFNKVNTHKGIEGIILSDSEGVPIKSTFNEDEKTYFPLFDIPDGCASDQL